MPDVENSNRPRRKGAARDYALFIVLLVLAYGAHINFGSISDVPLALYPLPLLITIYIGYRFGKIHGLIFGFLAPALMLATIASQYDGPSTDLLHLRHFKFESLTIEYISLQYIVIAGVVGYAGGWLFDKFDDALKTADTSLDDLIPRRQMDLGWMLITQLNRIIETPRFRIRLPKPDLADVSSVEATPGIARTIVSKSKQLSSTITLDIGYLLLIGAILAFNYSTTVRFGAFRLDLFPDLAAGVLILVTAYVRGWKFAAGLSLLTLTASTLFWSNHNSIRDALNLSSSLRPVIDTLPDLIGLLVFSWWTAQLGRLCRNPEMRPIVLRVVASYRREMTQTGTVTLVPVVLIAFFAISFAWTAQHYNFHYVARLAIALVLAVWGMKCQNVALINRVAIVLSIITIASINMQFSLSEGTRLSLFTLKLTVYDAAVFILFTLASARMNLTTMSNCRLLSYGLLLLLTLPDLLLDTRAPMTSIFSIHPMGIRLDILSWLFTLGAFEILAHILVWQSGRPGNETRASTI